MPLVSHRSFWRHTDAAFGDVRDVNFPLIIAPESAEDGGKFVHEAIPSPEADLSIESVALSCDRALSFTDKGSLFTILLNTRNALPLMLYSVLAHKSGKWLYNSLCHLVP